LQKSISSTGRKQALQFYNQEEAEMRFSAPLFFFVACSFAVCSLPAAADDFPSRKAGLWEVKMTMPGGHSVTTQQCIDAQTDQAMQSNADARSKKACSKNNVQTSGNTTTVDSVCTIAGKTRTTHTVITRVSDTSYTAVTTTEGGSPAMPPMTTAGKWLGPCAADQKPGDMIMPNGTKMNILDMQKRGVPGAPPQQ
jgi:hypothetical protein